MPKYRNRARGANRPNPRVDRNWNDPTLDTDNRKKKRHEYNPTSELPRPIVVDIKPRNANQKSLLSSLRDPNTSITFAIGPAGTGKSYISTLHAIRCLKAGLVEKIVITRPCVAVDGEDIGYLPGDANAKMMPWMMPILDTFAEYYSQAAINSMIENKILEMVPIAFVRGRTFKKSLVLVDEAQNTTPSSLLSILTRIGEGSKMVVTGDTAQSDRKFDNGLQDFLNRWDPETVPSVDVIEFDSSDVVRHPVIAGILAIYGEG